MELLKFIIYSISFVIGVQISKGDLKLLKGKIEYSIYKQLLLNTL